MWIPILRKDWWCLKLNESYWKTCRSFSWSFLFPSEKSCYKNLIWYLDEIFFLIWIVHQHYIKWKTPNRKVKWNNAKTLTLTLKYTVNPLSNMRNWYPLKIVRSSSRWLWSLADFEVSLFFSDSFELNEIITKIGAWFYILAILCKRAESQNWVLILNKEFTVMVLYPVDTPCY